jgi:hypothetical protein
MFAFFIAILVLFGVIAFWFVFIVWLPHRVHVIRIGLRYGWPSEKREMITELLLDRTITAVGYTGGTYDPDEEFAIAIAGSFGEFVKSGKGTQLKTDPRSNELPFEVLKAFEGYLETPGDVVYLLWYHPFLATVVNRSGGKFAVRGDLPESLLLSPA